MFNKTHTALALSAALALTASTGMVASGRTTRWPRAA